MKLRWRVEHTHTHTHTAQSLSSLVRGLAPDSGRFDLTLPYKAYSLDGNRGPRAPPGFFYATWFFFILKVSIFRICQVPSWNNVPKASFLTLCCTRPEPEKSKNYIESGITFEVNNIQRQINTFSHTIMTPGIKWNGYFWHLTTYWPYFWTKIAKKWPKMCRGSTIFSFSQAHRVIFFHNLLFLNHSSVYFKIKLGTKLK